jgi:hypothetical protein
MKINKRSIIITSIIMASMCAILFIMHYTCRHARPDEMYGRTRYQTGITREVVFDQSYTQLSSPFDTGFEGMSILTAELRKRGISVSINSRPLHKFLAHYRGPGRVLVMGMPTVQSGQYRANDVAAIDSFVKSGGGVLSMYEHDNAYNNHQIQKKLLARYGVTAFKENAFGPETTPDLNMWPRSSSSFLGINNIKLYYAASLRLSDGAEPFSIVDNPLLKDHAINGAINRKHGGTVVVLGDYEILWNMTPESGIRYGNNLAFIIRTIELLMGNQKNSADKQLTVPGFEELRKGSNPGGTVFFSLTGNGLAPDKSISGLYRLAEKLHRAGYRITAGDSPPANGICELIISACPVSAVDPAAILARARKYLLAADGQTDIYHALPEMKTFINGIQKGFNLTYNDLEYEYPLNRVVEPMGFTFVSSTIISEKAARQFEVASSWLDDDSGFSIRRGCFIKTSVDRAAAPVKVIARTGEKNWDEKNLMNTIYRLNEIRRYEPAVRGKGNYPVAVSSPRVFALSDVELLTNQFMDTAEGEELFLHIIKWLNSGIK